MSSTIDKAPNEILRPLFEKAKAIDEFEFGFALLRVRGIEGPGWNPWLESQKLIHQILSLLQVPLENDLKLRLLLFLYCHVTEMDDPYDFVENLLRIGIGERCGIMPLSRGGKKKVVYPNTKVAHIVKSAQDAGFPDVGRIFDEMFVKNVRNAFYHSDYVLYKDSFNIVNGDGVIVSGTEVRNVPLDWLVPKLELGIDLVLATIDVSIEYLESYKEEKTVPARMGPHGSIIDAVMIVKEGYGLVGFRSPNASVKL